MGGLQFRGSVNSHHGVTWWYAGRRGAGAGTDSPYVLHRQQEAVSDTGCGLSI